MYTTSLRDAVLAEAAIIPRLPVGRAASSLASDFALKPPSRITRPEIAPSAVHDPGQFVQRHQVAEHDPLPAALQYKHLGK
ncbi:MAG: hypothetical protein M3O34_16245 [Chloroflexota bacterium]|nr:hypothetical protein [Chloroflexota bacterium]